MLAVAASFLIAGALALGDYGVGFDTRNQRAIGNATLDYLTGDGERAFNQLVNPGDRYYGAILEAPLVLVERILGLEDSRDIHLSRHLLTHLFFLASGVCCYLLVYRLSASRALALLAAALFLLHPRIYVHSFVNSKDVPFLAMFMVTLHLVHRAFRRDTIAAFILCGMGVGLLVNFRILGILLFAAVLALRALDLVTASHARERGRVLLTGCAFALTAILTFHASLPALWTDPASWADPVGQFAEMIRAFNTHPSHFNLFRGELFYAPDGPSLDYVPVWIGITTPPATLLFALAGVLALALHGLHHPRDTLRNGPLRFGLFLLALPIVTTIAVVVLENNIYGAWRHVYFLYAPLLLLAVIGLQWLASPPRGRWTRAGVYALTGAAVAVAIVSMIRIHPYQHIYFNHLTDRAAPEQLASRYAVQYWPLPPRDLLGDIIAEHPSGRLHLAIPHAPSRWLLPARDRERFTVTQDFRSGERNFSTLRDLRPCPVAAPGTYANRLYANTLYCIVDPVAYFGGLRQRALAMEPLDRSRFDAHRVGGVLVYLRDDCDPADLRARTFLHIFPAAPADLPIYSVGFPDHHKEYGFEKRDFTFRDQGARIDGNCVAVASLPGYPIASIRTGQYTPEYAARILRTLGDATPLARSRFDIHFDPGGPILTYVRDGCSAEDAAARFFLHLFPDDARDIPEHQREHGFDNLDFHLGAYGARTTGGRCAAAVPLPRYPIASVRTGQIDGGERLWEVAIALPGRE